MDSQPSLAYNKDMAIMDLIFGDIHYRLGFGAQNGFLGIAGNLVGKNTQRLVQAFRKIGPQVKGRLIVSLEGLKSLDNSAISLFLREKQRLKEQHCDMIFVDVPAPILTLMHDTGLDTSLDFTPTLREVEAKYGQVLH